MGIEANCLCHYEHLAFEVKAILESQELILRASLKLRAPIFELSEIHEKGGYLGFKFKGENYRLELGANAKKWEEMLLKNLES